MVFYTSCIYAFKLVFKSLSSLSSPFGVITGLELHWMGDGPVGEKECDFESFAHNSRAEQP